MLAVAVFVWAALAILDQRYPPPVEALTRPPAVTVLGADGEPLRLFLPADDRWRLPVGLDELPPELQAAVIAAEDSRFYRHPGVDPLAILRATWQNLRAGRVVSGGSTLPMQLARLAEPAPRTLAAKLREAVRAVQLERRFSKRQLLEIYLNLAPYGGNLEGVAAASWFYFGKQPAALSPGEMALLVALPRSPNLYDPTRDPDRPPAAALAVRGRVLDRLLEAGVFDARQVAAARRQPLPRRRQPVPFIAPHFTRWAAERSPGEVRVATTLDRSSQRIAEAQVARHVPGLRRQGIAQAAVVVLETRGRRLRALVGSAGFLEPGRAGQVDGARARRSPGSTLKPFLYALAVDRGLIVPDSYLLDVPTDYAGYVAENFDGRYHGRVTAREALRRSLNAPAVRLLARVGLGPFRELLVGGGISTLDRPTGRYGLPLVLGAGEVSLLELTNLYATLADGGRTLPLAWRAPGPGPARQTAPSGPTTAGHRAGVRLLSRETARLITEILREVERPDLPDAWRLARDVPAVAWKTGTSYGHRDAWAVGYSGRYTIGVWVGNFDGAARQGISGSQHAAPLLFDLFRALEPGGGEAGRDAGLRIESLEVCALSHQLPGPWCPSRTRIDYLPGRSRLERCDHHRRLRVAGGAGAPAFRETTRYPAELVAWWRTEGQELPAGTAVAAATSLPAGDPPRIVSPDRATPYHLRRDAPLEHQRIPLVAHAGLEVERLYWFRDGVLVADAAPDERLFLDPLPGAHRLVVTDDRGRSNGVDYEVRR
jgi:penicillin-binding protein 1C